MVDWDLDFYVISGKIDTYKDTGIPIELVFSNLPACGQFRGWNKRCGLTMEHDGPHVAMATELVKRGSAQIVWPDEIPEEYKEEVMLSPRADILDEAKGLVCGDRNVQYGDPNKDFQRIATFWNTYLTSVIEARSHEVGVALPDDVHKMLSSVIKPHDVGWMMNFVKASRSTHQANKRDSYADAAGYIACAWDCVVNTYDETR